MESHYLQTEAPKFKFEVLSLHKDALSRQLCEALHIRTQGNLNRKSEFAVNEIIRMQTGKYSWEQRKVEREQQRDQGVWEERIKCFVEVMSNVIRLCKNERNTMSDPNGLYCYRSIGTKRIAPKTKRKPTGPKKRRIMDTSTPAAYRVPAHDLNDSPIEKDSDDSRNQVSASSSGATNPEGSVCLPSNTGMSGEIDVLEVVTPVKDSKLGSLAKDHVTAHEHSDSEVSLNKRESLRTQTPVLNEGKRKLILEGKFHHQSPQPCGNNLTQVSEGMAESPVMDLIEVTADGKRTRTGLAKSKVSVLGIEELSGIIKEEAMEN